MDRIPLMQNNRLILGRKKTSNVIVTLFVYPILLLAIELIYIVHIYNGNFFVVEINIGSKLKY